MFCGYETQVAATLMLERRLLPIHRLMPAIEAMPLRVRSELDQIKEDCWPASSPGTSWRPARRCVCWGCTCS